MDPLDELKNLLNIPEGMTAGEAGKRRWSAHGQMLDHSLRSSEYRIFGALSCAWQAVENLLDTEADGEPTA